MNVNKLIDDIADRAKVCVDAGDGPGAAVAAYQFARALGQGNMVADWDDVYGAKRPHGPFTF
jgi:hypothetical protein